MKLASKIGLGYALVILAMSGILLYQASVIYQMQAGNRRLSEVSFEVASLATSLRQALDPVEEFSRKFSVTQDPGYLDQIEGWHETFQRDLEQLSELDLSSEVRERVASVEQGWNGYWEAAGRLRELSRDPSWMRSQISGLEDLGFQAEELISLIQENIRFQVREAARVGERAEKIALGVAVATLCVSLLLSFLIVRSVSTRLKGVVRGTRAVARGDFAFRLPDRSGDEFSGLAEDFNNMTQRLSELEETKRDFVSHVSHELKSPLASIQETTQLLLEGIPGVLAPEQKRLLLLSVQSTQRLGSTVDNLLDMSRLEAGVMEYHLTSCNLADLVEEAMAELESQSREKALAFDLESGQSPILVHCDQESTHRVVVNLLVNAVKFSPEGERILLRVWEESGIPEAVPPVCREDLVLWPARYAILSVADRGPGVSDHEKERIFERFGRGSRSQRSSVKGVGLGLSIARKIVQGNRGAIWVEDRPGGGSVFKVLLPLSDEELT